MNTSARRLLPCLVAAFIITALLGMDQQAIAQDLHPSRRPSPLGVARTFIGNTYVKVTYGRPYMRGRQIFGQNNGETTFLVPYGELWRTGANEAPEITLTDDLSIGGKRLAAGTYTFFTEPNPGAWIIHFSPQLGLDGTGRLGADGSFTANVYDQSNDVLVITAAAESLKEDIEQFTITFEPAAGGTHLVMRWEQTEVRIPVLRL